MSKAKESIGFGFDPTEAKNHFLIIIPKTATGKVLIYERFDWGTEEEDSDKISGELSMFDPPVQKIDQRNDRLKCELSKVKWKEIESVLRSEFNLRLKDTGQKAGNWKQGQTPVQRLLGKELTLLCWAIEDCDLAVIPIAVKNWQGLKPEERWWLYTMTNASTGEASKKYGWRIALRYALTENPVNQYYQQQDSIDKYLNDALEN